MENLPVGVVCSKTVTNRLCAPDQPLSGETVMRNLDNCGLKQGWVLLRSVVLGTTGRKVLGSTRYFLS